MKVLKIAEQHHLEQAFKIRQRVFVEEQKVSKEEEYDEFEDTATHFLAFNDQDKACGTARWRFTEKGIKLERFAVLKEERGGGTGSALVKKVLEDITLHPNSSGKLIYLHAQLTAVPLYEKFGFRKEGEIFEECAIQHYKMTKK